MAVYSTITKKISLPVYDVLNGRKVTRYFKEYEKSQWLSKKEIDKLQLKKLKKLLKYAYDNVEYYKKSFDKVKFDPSQLKKISDMNKLPILTKKEIIKHRDQLISKKYNKKNLVFVPTGGSTGEPLKLFHPKVKQDIIKAQRLRGDRWGGLDINEKHILLWGGPNEITVGNTIRGKIKHGIMNRKLLDTFYLQPKKMELYVKKINKFKPKAITGYTNSLYTFSKYIKDNKLKIHSPKAIFSTAEHITSRQRKLIEEVFRTQLYNCYGCREFGDVAQDCEKGNMHILADHVYVEFLKDNRPAKENEIAKIIITDLNNYAMPLIRYQIEDLGIPSEKMCDCGRGLPLMNVTKGRISDMFLMPDGRVIHGEYFTHLFYDLEGLKQFQLIQKKKDLIVIKAVKEPSLSEEEVRNTIKKLLKGKIDDRVKLKFEFPKKINPEKSGKYCFTKSEVKLDF